MRVRTLLLLIVGLPLLLVNVTLIALEFRQGEKQIQASLAESLQDMAHFRAIKLGNHFAKIVAPAMAQAEFMKYNRHLDEGTLFAQLERPLRNFSFVHGMGIAFDAYQRDEGTKHYAPYMWKDEEGVYHKTLLAPEQGVNYLRSEWFIAVQNTDTSYWSDPYMEPIIHNQPVVTFATPVVDEGELTGAVHLDIELRHIRSELQKLDMPNAEVAIVSNKGTTIIAPTCSTAAALRRGANAPSGKAPFQQDLNLFTEQARKHLPQTPLTLTSQTGEKLWFGHAPIENTNWLLVIILPEHLAMESLREATYNRLWGLCAGTLLLFAFIYYLINRSISRPLERLTAATRAIAGGKLETRIPLEGTSCEIQNLGYAFNEMGERLEQHIQKHLEANTARLKAEAASEAKSEFLARMSHEVRTPMNAIMGMAHLCLLTALTPKQKDYLAKIQSAAENLLRIINDILDFSKIEAGKMEIESTPYQLSELLNDLKALVTLKAQEKNLEVLFHIQPGVPNCLMGDPLRLSQILLNLTTNALKFTKTGEIIIGVKKENTANTPCPPPANSTGKSWELLHFWVQDSGIGMTAEQMGKLFQSFSQAEDYVTRQYGGTGLGLAISKNLAEMMGGTLWVESTQGVGSTFHCILPIITEENACVPLLAHDVSGMRVLVVDDSATAREIFREMLHHLGMVVDEAYSGLRAVEKVRQAKEQGEAYHLVLMDWQMPILNGVETTLAIRQLLGDNDDTAIFLMSCYDMGEYEQTADETLFQARLTKPVTPSVLLDTLMQTFGTINLEPHETAQKTIQNEYPHIAGKRILLVEDNDINQQIAMELLEDMGMVVSLANNGVEAIAMASTQPYDLILMDIQMPLMGGLEATQRIRELPHSGASTLPPKLASNALPIIAMTAHAMASDKQASLSAGMNDHITKPINPESLYATLEKWLA